MSGQICESLTLSDACSAIYTNEDVAKIYRDMHVARISYDLLSFMSLDMTLSLYVETKTSYTRYVSTVCEQQTTNKLKS